MKDHPNRQWHDDHVVAGYHEQEWIIPKASDPIIGSYACVGHGGTVEVRYLPMGPTKAPELEIEWADGMRVTVLDETVATAYLVSCRAAKRT